MRANQRFLLPAVAACALLFVLAPARYASAGAPCCSVTGIDQKSGVVTAKEKSTGRVFTFKVTDAKLLASLRTGQGVYANFTSKQVSVDGAAPCCAIASLEPPNGARSSVAQTSFVPCCNVTGLSASAGQLTLRENSSGRQIIVRVSLAPAQLAQTFKVGTAVGFQPVDGAKIAAGTRLRLQAAGFDPVDSIVSQVTVH